MSTDAGHQDIERSVSSSPLGESTSRDDAPVSLDQLRRRLFIKRTGMGCSTLALLSLLGEQGTLRAAGTSDKAMLRPRIAHHPARATSVIWLFMPGGVSQMDTFDYKPELQKRDGEPLPNLDSKTGTFGTTGKILGSRFQFRQYGETGTWVSEIFPHIARYVDDVALVYSCQTNSNNHTPSMLEMNSGSFLQGRPCFGSWLTYGLGTENSSLPGFVLLHGEKPRGQDILWSSGFLPKVYEPTTIDGRSQASVANLTRRKSTTDLQQREFLDGLRQLDELHRSLRPHEADLAARLESFELAYRMQSAAPEALDLSSESKTTHENYGIGGKQTDLVGRQCLTARRLVERGVRFVQIYAGSEFKTLIKDIPWDAHAGLESNHRKNGLAVDQPIAALLHDLKQRGLLDSTLVIWGGEFGRTADSQGKDGRDHNPYAATMWMAGAGIRAGARYGKTDDFAYQAVENPFSVNDLHATILHLLGIDHERLTYRFNGRDFRLTDVGGRVIGELLS